MVQMDLELPHPRTQEIPMDSIAKQLAQIAQELAPVETEIATLRSARDAARATLEDAERLLGDALAKWGVIMTKLPRLPCVGSSGEPSNLAIRISAEARAWFDRPIDDLGLSTRSDNILKAENVFLVGELVQWSAMCLLKTPNMGRRNLSEIRNVLLARGLSLGMDLDGVWQPPEQS